MHLLLGRWDCRWGPITRTRASITRHRYVNPDGEAGMNGNPTETGDERVGSGALVSYGPRRSETHQPSRPRTRIHSLAVWGAAQPESSGARLRLAQRGRRSPEAGEVPARCGTHGSCSRGLPVSDPSPEFP